MFFRVGLVSRNSVDTYPASLSVLNRVLVGGVAGVLVVWLTSLCTLTVFYISNILDVIVTVAASAVIGGEAGIIRSCSLTEVLSGPSC